MTDAEARGGADIAGDTAGTAGAAGGGGGTDAASGAGPSGAAGPTGGTEPAGRSRGDGVGRTVVIGLTGPIGCGKSTIAGWLGELGATVIDADVVAREVVEPGEPALDQVLEAFGPEVAAPDGALDRAALGRIVFTDPEALARLESIVHPAVRPRILERIAAASRNDASAVVVEAIKLVEGGLAALCDEVWLVVCDPISQRERLLARAARTGPTAPTGTAHTETGAARSGSTPDLADTDARMAAQADIVERLLPAASRVIDTSGSLLDTRAAVESAYTDATSPEASSPDATPPGAIPPEPTSPGVTPPDAPPPDANPGG